MSDGATERGVSAHVLAVEQPSHRRQRWIGGNDAAAGNTCGPRYKEAGAAAARHLWPQQAPPQVPPATSGAAAMLRLLTVCCLLAATALAKPQPGLFQISDVD